MSVGYRVVGWSTPKRRYDLAVVAAVLAFLVLHAALSSALHPGDHAISPPILAMRALGSCAFLLLTAILCIGPAARISPRALPVLFNRRHLGVITFLVALAHAIIALGFYHGFGVLNPLVSLLGVNPNFLSLHAFPFQVLGLGTLIVLFLLASTSHDFWNRNLGPSLWKSLHMLVYPAYALLVAHVALGALQTDRGLLLPAVAIASVALVAALHAAAALRERTADQPAPAAHDPVGWIDAGDAASIPIDRARTVCAAGERIAIFRHKDGISAVTNRCAHQNGPLGEGKIIDGCITCPWHGWQYKPADGQSPPPFTEKITTYQVRVVAGRVLVNPQPNAPGTPVEPAPLHTAEQPA